MAYAAVDLHTGISAEGFVEELARQMAGNADADRPADVWVTEVQDRARVTVMADFGGNVWLGDVLARASGDLAYRAVLGLDHDEYGVEHVVLDGRQDRMVRVHHVYVYPEGEVDPDCPPTMTDLPARSDLTVNPDGTLTGSDALAVVAALYEVEAAAMVRAAQRTVRAYEDLQIIFTPLAPWWEAIGVTYPGELGEPTLTLPPGTGGGAATSP